MSFYCEFCKKLADDGTKLRMVPVEVRQRTYYNGPGRDESYGSEIVRELRCCEVCWKEGVYTATIGETNHDAPMTSIALLQNPSEFIASKSFS